MFKILNSVKMAIVVRTDLKMGRGKIAAQAAHAAVVLYRNSSEEIAKIWFLKGQPKIILKVDSSDALTQIYDSAMSHNLNCCKIHDAGRTQIDPGSITAVGIGPDKDEIIDKITCDLKLL